MGNAASVPSLELAPKPSFQPTPPQFRFLVTGIKLRTLPTNWDIRGFGLVAETSVERQRHSLVLEQEPTAQSPEYSFSDSNGAFEFRGDSLVQTNGLASNSRPSIRLVLVATDTNMKTKKVGYGCIDCMEETQVNFTSSSGMLIGWAVVTPQQKLSSTSRPGSFRRQDSQSSKTPTVPATPRKVAEVSPKQQQIAARTKWPEVKIFNAEVVIQELSELATDNEKTQLLMKRTIDIVVALSAAQLEKIIMQLQTRKERLRCLNALSPHVTNVEQIPELLPALFPRASDRTNAIKILNEVVPQLQLSNRSPPSTQTTESSLFPSIVIPHPPPLPPAQPQFTISPSNTASSGASPMSLSSMDSFVFPRLTPSNSFEDLRKPPSPRVTIPPPLLVAPSLTAMSPTFPAPTAPHKVITVDLSNYYNNNNRNNNNNNNNILSETLTTPPASTYDLWPIQPKLLSPSSRRMKVSDERSHSSPVPAAPITSAIVFSPTDTNRLFWDQC